MSGKRYELRLWVDGGRTIPNHTPGAGMPDYERVTLTYCDYPNEMREILAAIDARRFSVIVHTEEEADVTSGFTDSATGHTWFDAMFGGPAGKGGEQ